MSYLTRLVARHAEAVPHVRPRAASRFETGGAAEFVATTEEAVAAAAPAEPRPSVDAAPASARDASRAETPAPGASTTRRRDDSPPAPRTARPSIVPLRDEPPPVETPTRFESSVVAAIRVVESLRTSADAVDAADRADVAPDAAPRSTALVAPRRALVVAASRATSARRRDVETSTPREPDVVHVHIGRVEVRAQMPAAERPRAAPRPRDAARPMPLDRYLAGRKRP